ncbi:LysR family transcriptional regulator [Microbulbifer sp. A4B17]|uniref:LysR substrate-binding domain-containing protein n=1 Tax=Microbulbifer sp. A4B17 TaxID=359370 RepID=UPI000D52DC89|nr:LysR substrate-binding domain-containing protein [Microbulbifer sp. A4B17]AWF81399.1 LysR family transcriptional regulator [Microbulbifer sp. A4B17]
MYPNLPSLNALKVFDAAARLGSFKRAAEELFITPTAVSHQIKGLEESLGTTLFERKTRAVQLTSEGQMLAQTTSQIFQQLTETVSEITCSKKTLTVSTTSSFAAMWLVPHLENFYQKFPDIIVSVVTGEEVSDIERDRRIDIAIRYGKYDESTKNALHLATETIGVYAAPSYLTQIRDISEAQLLETKWVNSSLPPLNWQTLLKRKLDGIRVRQFDQEHHVIQAALAGQGIALVSSLLVQNPLRNQWLVPYRGDSKFSGIEGFTYSALIPSRHSRNGNVLAFVTWLKEALRDSPYS